MSSLIRTIVVLTAVNLITASGTVTNRLLEDLIVSIETAQAQDRQWIATVLEQIELNRLEDKGQLGNALFDFANFAVQTDEELNRTQQNVELIAKFLSNTETDNLIQNEFENSNN